MWVVPRSQERWEGWESLDGDSAMRWFRVRKMLCLMLKNKSGYDFACDYFDDGIGNGCGRRAWHCSLFGSTGKILPTNLFWVKRSWPII